MYNIVLLCQWGASTDLVAEKIREAASEQGIEVMVNAYPANELANIIDTADIVMLGPQVRFKQKEFLKQYADKKVPIVLMDPSNYGLLNGKAILESAIKSINENN